MMHNYEFKIPQHLKSPTPDPVSTPTVALTLAESQLSPRALYQDVAERLRQQIFNRELEPGSWIDEQKLAADYGISRTPLREAL